MNQAGVNSSAVNPYVFEEQTKLRVAKPKLSLPVCVEQPSMAQASRNEPFMPSYSKSRQTEQTQREVTARASSEHK
jgi:hypothetical protein